MIRARWLRRLLRRWLYGSSSLVPMDSGELYERCMKKHFAETANPSALQ